MAAFASGKKPFRGLVFLPRLPGISHEQFKEHYEGRHMSLLKSLGGEQFPTSHVRKYISEESFYPGTTAGDLPWDCITQVEWRDEEHFTKFMAAINQGNNKAERQADEAKFIDVSKMKAVWGFEEKETTA